MNPLLVAGVALIFAFGALICAVWAVFRVMQAEIYAEKCADWMQENNKKAKITALEAEITEIVDSMASIRESLHKMRSRIGMREYRDRKKAAPATPEYPNTPEGRDAERAALEKELAESGRLNPRIHQMRPG